MSNKYKNAIPLELEEIFNDIEAAGGEFTVDSEIKIFEMRIYQLVKSDNPTAKVWKELKSTWNSYKRAKRNGDANMAMEALKVIDILMDTKYITDNKWNDILQLSEQRRRLIETNTKNKLAEQEMISMQTLTDLVGNYGRKVTNIIKNYIPDIQVQEKIANDILEIEIE